MTPMKWTERRFEFGHPSDLFPNVLERLRGTPARIRDILRSVPPDVLTRRPASSKWSIQEHVGHLGDIEEVHEGRIDDFIFHAKRLRPADITNRKTHDADHNSVELDRVLNRFGERRNQFVGRLSKLDEETLHILSLHPRIEKPMRIIDLMVFVAEHDDHHLASIRDLLIRFGHP